MISDRDPRFTSHFARALAAKLGASQNLSTAFHPQTDGLSERKNQWIEQYLRLLTAGQQDDWSQWLSIATAVHNDRTNDTLGMSPNEALLGYRPRLFPAQPVPTLNESAEKQISTLHQKRAQATMAINHAAKTSSTPKDVFKLNDQVWLESKHLALPHQSKKLAPKRVGPFRITKVISPVAFRLDLPPSWHIHDVFHASLLTPYHETTAYGPNFIKLPPDLIDGEEEYEVEAILNHRTFGHRHQAQYLIKWKGYPHSDNMWEPSENVHADDLIRAYHKRRPLEDKMRQSTRARTITSWNTSSNPLQPSSSLQTPGSPITSATSSSTLVQPCPTTASTIPSRPLAPILLKSLSTPIPQQPSLTTMLPCLRTPSSPLWPPTTKSPPKASERSSLVSSPPSSFANSPGKLTAQLCMLALTTPKTTWRLPWKFARTKISTSMRPVFLMTSSATTTTSPPSRFLLVRASLSPQSSSRGMKTTRLRYGESLDVLARENPRTLTNSSLVPLKIPHSLRNLCVPGSFASFRGAPLVTPTCEKRPMSWAIGGSLPTLRASVNARINFASSTPPFTPFTPKPTSLRPSKTPVAFALGPPTLMDTSPNSSPSATARTVISPFTATSPFAQPLIEAMDEDVHSEQGVMSPAPRTGLGCTR